MGDIDLDGDLDLLYNLDDGQVSYPAELETGFYGNHLEYADMVGDGTRDLILTKKSTGQSRWSEPAAGHPRKAGWSQASSTWAAIRAGTSWTGPCPLPREPP